MTHHTDPRAIEEKLDRDRAALGETIDALQDRLSAERLAQEALGLIRSNATSYTQSLDRAVRSNPMALALTGVGLAWLVFGGRRVTPEAGPRASSIARWEDEGGTPLPEDFQPSAAEGADASGVWARRIDTLRERASAALRSLEAEARTQSNGVRDFAAERAKVLAGFTEDLRKSMTEGLDGLSEAARQKVVQAREKAYAARIRVDSAARTGGREVERLINDHPMIAGVVAMAVGAAIAAALPRTRTEDRAFGAESDRLMDAAAQLLREERAKVAAVASEAATELKSAATEARAAVAEKVADIGTKVAARAEADAEAAQVKAKHPA